MAESLSNGVKLHPRPLSPHLQVYKPQLTSITSILHRFSGIALSAGVLYLLCWLLAVAGGAEQWARRAPLPGKPMQYPPHERPPKPLASEEPTCTSS